MLATLLRSAVNRSKEHLHLSWNGKFVFAVVTSTPTCFPLTAERISKSRERTNSLDKRSLLLQAACTSSLHALRTFLPSIPFHLHSETNTVLLSLSRTHMHINTCPHEAQGRNVTQRQTQTHCAYLLSLKITKWGEERKKERARARLSESRRNKQEPS